MKTKSKSVEPNFNIAKFLLTTNNYNGHFQTTVTGLSIQDCLDICKDLEAYRDLGKDTSFVCEVWTDGGISIYQKDYWKDGEHPSGHKDRLILGVGE